MTEQDLSPGRIGRPPKVDAARTPTRERLLRAAIDSCVEFGYEHALDAISTTWLPGEAGLREIARYWLHPNFASTRILVAELHCAAIREPDVRNLLAAWQADNAHRLERLARLSSAQVKAYYLLLIGLSHVDEVSGVDVDQRDLECQLDALIDGWFTASA